MPLESEQRGLCFSCVYSCRAYQSESGKIILGPFTSEFSIHVDLLDEIAKSSNVTESDHMN